MNVFNKELSDSSEVKIRQGDYLLENSGGSLRLFHESNRKYTPITWRDSPEYFEGSARYCDNGGIPQDILVNPEFRHLQIIEIAPGLGGLTPDLARIAQRPPIAIDPIDYRVILDILTQSQKMALSPTDKALVTTLIERIHVYLDPKFVQLLNMTIEEACDKNPWLEGIADVVIDLAGAYTYAKDAQHVKNLETKWLLKDDPRGRYYIG